jgi:hypothetical protein
MREASVDPLRLSRGNFRDQYWTVAQLLAHHTSNGCNLRPGDLFGSGTVSGPVDDARGCLLELTRRGADPVRLPTGEVRNFLKTAIRSFGADFCEREGAVRIDWVNAAVRFLAGGIVNKVAANADEAVADIKRVRQSWWAASRGMPEI